MPRTRGWGGNPPADDDEARTRIIAATKRCLDRYGATKTGLADVATELGVTRQTVYRYFTTTDDLFSAAALDASGDFMARIAAHLAQFSEPDELVAEAITWILEQVPNEPYIGILLTPEKLVSNATLVDSRAQLLGRTVMSQLSVDWGALGFDEQDLSDLTEFMLRLFASYLTYPDETRSRDELKAYIRRWAGGALRSLRSGVIA